MINDTFGIKNDAELFRLNIQNNSRLQMEFGR